MMPPNEISTTPCPAHEISPIGDEVQPSPRSDVRERPILFSAPMVRALLAGTKAQTRRVVKHRWPYLWQEPWYATGKVLTDLPRQPGAFMEFRYRQQDDPNYQGSPASTLVPCPYGKPGDRLWVRETFAPLTTGYAYCADPIWNAPPADRWRPSIHMPRAASRILLEVTGVRVERLQDISKADAIAEGIERREDACGDWKHYGDTGLSVDAVGSYRSLWETINGEASWKADPWVWVVEFRRVAP